MSYITDQYGHQPALKTSPTQDYFQLMFEGVDAVSSPWQPLAKGVGRWGMEMAQLNARQSRMTLEYSQKLLRCYNPLEAFSETMNFWQKLYSNYADASKQVATVAVKAAQPQMPFELLPLPVRRTRDTIVLPDADEPELPLRHIADAA
jgi:hypothetical protein